VIDNQPLWLSLRGMVGCNLYRDGIWPIISNDGHLSYVRFKKDVRMGSALFIPVVFFLLVFTLSLTGP
jgi:hypothetical protein